ncbi:MAG: hypothetical protein ABFS46_02745, partial [Myxococcota bacterium]
MRRPLVFAHEAAAGADRIRDLERTLARAAARAGQLSIPSDVRTVLARVEALFAEDLPPEQRSDAIERALSWTEPLAAPGFPESALARPVSCLPGAGPRRAEQLARRGLGSVGDLLYLLPFRWEDRRAVSSVAELSGKIGVVLENP